MKVIGISGPAGSGKDTFAKMLHEELIKLGFHGVIAAYADLLKYILTKFFGWNGEKDEAGRTLLQTVGTEIVRAKDPDFWVDHLMKMAELFGDQWDYMIIPDVRFHNEVDKWRESDYPSVFLGIVRDFESNLTEEQQNHASETELNDFIPDMMVDNIDLERLQETAALLASQMGL